MLLAQSGTVEIPTMVAPMVVSGLAVLAIVIVILTKHQRRMAELYLGQANSDALTEELRSMRAEMNRLSAKVDSLGAGSTPPETIPRRLEVTDPSEIRTPRLSG